MAHIDGTVFTRMVRGGAGNLFGQRTVINELNVFPIPDGDTGDNMHLTIKSGAQNVGEKTSLSDVAAAIADGMLRGARGNSGVILSRYFKGIALGLSGSETADTDTFSEAIGRGVVEAYHAVSTPVEGTILTVAKEGADYAASRITAGQDVGEYLDNLIAGMKISLENTPEKLPVLKEAGVVDSGGAGLLVITEGMREGLLGKEYADAESKTAQPALDFDKFTENDEMVFGYCTEFLLRLQSSKVDLASFDLPAFIGWLEANGNSVVAFRDGSIVKVHVHTMHPGEILNFAQQYGEFLTLKIENMTLQHEGVTIRNNFSLGVKKPEKKYGVVTVATGAGLRDTFSSLGADAVIDGGQSYNPSAEDFLRAFADVNAETVFVFPNNGNIVLTARQAAELYRDADVRVIPSKNIGEGISAISKLDLENPSADAIEREALANMKNVVTGTVSRASRDSSIGKVAVYAGDFIGFTDDDILTDDKERTAALLKLTDALPVEKYDVALLLFGCDVPADEAEGITAELTAQYPHTEIISIYGGQPIFDYILILE